MDICIINHNCNSNKNTMFLCLLLKYIKYIHKLRTRQSCSYLKHRGERFSNSANSFFSLKPMIQCVSTFQSKCLIELGCPYQSLVAIPSHAQTQRERKNET